MKIFKIYAASALLLASGALKAQTFLTQDFSTGSGSTPPTGWVNNIITGVSPADMWRYNNPGGRTPTAPIAGQFAIFDSDNYSNNSTAENVALESPAVSTVGTATQILLKWDQIYRGGAGGAAFVEVYNGTTWNQVYTFAPSSGTTQASPSIDVTTHAVNRAGVKVRFRWTGNWSWYWGVDNVQLLGINNCSGTPTPGNTLTSSSTFCPGGTVNLSLQNDYATFAGITYQWQSSPDNISYTNVATGGTSATYTASPTAATYYKCLVKCGSNTGPSNPVQVTQGPFMGCYCLPQIGGTSSNGCYDNDYITNVAIGTLNNPSGCAYTGIYAYTNYNGTVPAPNLPLGSSQTISVTVENSWSENVAVWIDYNHSGTFDASEFLNLGTSSGTGGIRNSGPNQTLTGTINIPATALSGLTMMRVKDRFSTTQGATEACTSYSYGECEDYPVNLTCPGVTISTQPVASTTICSGSNASLTAAGTTTTGFTVSYQWQIYNGSTWNNIANGGIYAGATTGTLTITGATTTADYRCMLSNNCGTSLATNTATLTVNSATVLSSSPSSAAICAGSNTSMSVTATGSSLTYLWEVNTGSSWTTVSNGGVYSTATTATLTITGATAGMNGYQYRCTVSGACPVSPQTSTVATLTVNTAPAVTAHPANVSICPSLNTSFSTTATGSGLTYQWQMNTGSSWVNVPASAPYSNTTSATMDITGTTLAMNGYQFRCIVSGTCPSPITTNPATLTVRNDVAITTSPANKTICTGTSNTFNVTATGFNISYQWEVNTGSSWSNVTNGGVYSGATTASLGINNPTLVMNGYQYRCVVTNQCAITATSTAATMTVTSAPVITTQPTDKNICNGSGTTLTVVASATGPISYQWQVFNGSTWNNIANGANYGGATTSTLSLISFPAGTYSYRCLLSTGCTPDPTSATATVIVSSMPAITAHPQNSVACVNGNKTFTAAGTGGSLNYQWEVNTGSSWAPVSNGSTYSNVTTANLTVSNITAGMNNYQYRCVVTNVCGSATTNPATLTIAASASIVTQPTAKTICSGGSTTFTVVATGANLSYKWYQSSPLAEVPPFSGTATPTLTVSNYTIANGNVTFPIFCEITGTCGTINSTPTTLTVHANTAITSNPVAQSICEGATATFTVGATGSNLTYQWERKVGTIWQSVVNGGNVSGATTASLVSNTTPTSFNGNEYRCVVTGTCGAQISGSAILTVTPTVNPAITITASKNDICAGTSVTFNSLIVGTGTYQWMVNGNVVGTASSYTSSTLNNNDIVLCVLSSTSACRSTYNAGSNQIIMKVTPLSTPTIAITSTQGNTVCSDVPITFTSTVTNGGTNPTYQWKVNGVNMTGGSSFVTSNLLQGDVVKCDLTSSLKCPSPATVSSNSITMTVNKTTRSSVVIAPNTDTSLCENEPVTMLTYFTNGGALPKYQWLINGVDIQGQTNATLQINTIDDKDVIQCRFISSALCVFPELSNPVTFVVTKNVVPSVDMAVSFNGGNSYTFTALPVNGGANPKYQWYVNGYARSGETAQTFTTDQLAKTDRVTVDMSSDLECVTNSVVSSIRYTTTGIDNVANVINELGLHPNPNTGAFTVTGKMAQSLSAEMVTIKITNTVGQTVYSQSYKVNGNKLDLPVSLNESAPNGLYMANIIIGGQTTTIRFNLNR